MRTLHVSTLALALLSASCEEWQPTVPGASIPLLSAGTQFVTDFDYSKNMHPMGFSARANTAVPLTANTDVAFWGRHAVQGNFDGFRIIDISSPASPREIIDYRDCRGSQGDVVIWDNILIRSWQFTAGGLQCGGVPLLVTDRGIHIELVHWEARWREEEEIASIVDRELTFIPFSSRHAEQ